MRRFEHVEVENLDELLELLSEFKEEARINAGGTDLLSLFKDRYLFNYPKVLINVKPVKELDYLELVNGALRIGSLTKLSTLARNPVIIDRFPILRETVLTIASPQIRNMATVGGNLCQDIRCWYYRYPSSLGGPLLCARKKGKSCLAVKGDNRYHALIGEKCYAVCPSDLATALSSLKAKLVIVKKGAERKIDVWDLYTPQGLGIGPDEVIKEVEIPLEWAKEQKFIKYTLRKPIDFAIVSVASCFKFEGGRISDCAISLGGVSFRPERLKEAEDLLRDAKIDEGLVEEIKRRVLSNVRPLSKNGYKITIARELIGRVLLSLM